MHSVLGKAIPYGASHKTKFTTLGATYCYAFKPEFAITYVN